jgi:hypothetical protein
MTRPISSILGPITPGMHTLSGEIFRNGLHGDALLAISAYNNDGLIGSVTPLSDPAKVGVWIRYSCTIDVTRRHHPIACGYDL